MLTAFLMLKSNEPYRYAKPETVRVKLNEVRRKAGEPAPKKKFGEMTGPEPTVGRLNTTYRRPALPAAKSPEQWSAAENRSLAAGVTAFAREVHADPVKRPRTRPKPKS